MISYFPQSVPVNITSLRNGSETNVDGHGFAVASHDGIERGGSMNFDLALEMALEARNRHGSRSALLFHSRYGTHGIMGDFNIHPFWTDDNHETVMAHNGILPEAFHPSKGDPRSDTRIFVDHIVNPHFAARGIPSRRGARQLAQMIGTWNKLVFLSVATGEPRARIINQDSGIWDGGAWYSNSGYRSFHYAIGQKRYDFSAMGSRNWWNNDDDIVEAELVPADVCHFCSGEVDLRAGLCIECDTCQDCLEHINDCLCYVPASSSGILQFRDFDAS